MIPNIIYRENPSSAVHLGGLYPQGLTLMCDGRTREDGYRWPLDDIDIEITCKSCRAVIDRKIEQLQQIQNRFANDKAE